MKKITILLILFSVNCFSQIAIEKPNNETEIDQPLVAEFNEKIDLHEYKTAEQFLGLVGKELFFLPENSKYDFYSDQYESISYLPKTKFKLGKARYRPNQLVNLKKWDKELIDFLKLKENYFVVDSVNFYNGAFSFREKINGREFNERQEKYQSSISLSGNVEIYTHHKTSNEIIIFNISNKSSSEKLISVPYFNYLTDKYLDKKIILKKRGYKHYTENYEIENYNRKHLDSSQIFQITKITIKEPNTEYHSHYTPVFSLKKLDNTIEELEFYRIKDNLIFWNDFVAGADLREKRETIRKDSLEKEKIADAKLRQEQRELRQIDNEKKRIVRLNKFVKKYGKEYGEIVTNYKVRIGMTKEMCEDSWGKPESINRTTNAYGTSEQWVYDGGSYLYFDNVKLTSIQN
ncbi:hypothetical protein ESY86_20150 [Subsaximicrobium wynnwilliamsii]|uniref:Uncharacterized protein n=1 Tax=Subsaximicrobium wynnwilliamsii TaxID=291179 RepID=A0A5C6Z9M4_9FLAO|nr:hypothetical protein [Subsaximicrobium wynnwilliamsii]TXD81073.1 hypothetical protein ESY87_19485 [Subsaximicrobium wynnwilliamsii]TXD86461.1 hypothetical protein ESY86_20150 [Subsaximicrobium wynnwilliamsii]TXE00066.1 hypothetical protein ESY88_20125 [Subsaximicrobium wynnwilliamsii]